MVKINGSSFPHQYRRTNPFPIDSTDVWDTIEEAHIYARNTDTEPYMPYAGQIISVPENGNVYKLVKDDSIPETDGKEHFKLEIIGSTSDLDGRYLRNDIESTAKELIHFLKGVNAKGVSTLEEITLLKNIASKNFAAGSTGFGIYQDADGNYHLDIDFVNIRKKLSVEELQVQQSRYIGGKQYNTSGGIICNRVEDMGTYWKCSFKTTDPEGRRVYNTFEVDDQGICETFNLKSGNHYYWRLVNVVGDDYIGLLKADCAVDSDVPAIGDEIVQLGNRTNTLRQGAIVWDSVTIGSPYVRLYNGINSYTMPKPLIDLNTVLSEITAKFKSEATGKDIDNTIKDMQTDLDLVKEQTDKEYTLWFYDYDPTLDNLPASDWTTDKLKATHEQDMFYNEAAGHAFRFEKVGASWTWADITDKRTLKALESASKAQDTADNKRRVFVSQPTTKNAYDAGDLWVNANYTDSKVTYKNDFLVCKIAKASGTEFSIIHWQPSSTATTAYMENLGNRITIAVTDSEEGIAAAKKLANQGISDAYAAAESALEALGIAKNAEGTATRNTAAIQVTKESIAALVQGIHFDNSGKITNINTSGLVTTDSFNTLLSQKITFDANGHVSNISTSGLVTEAGFTQMFSEQAESDGYVKRAEISTFITEDDAGRLISNANIEADNINFVGKVLMNGKMLVDEHGNMTIDGLVANNGTFKGKIEATSGLIGGFGIDGYNLDNRDNRDCWISLNVKDGDGSVRTSSLGNNLPGITGVKTAGYFGATGSGANVALMLHASKSTLPDIDGGGKYSNYALVGTGGCKWKKEINDYWCMPGVLFAIDVDYDGNVGTRWGNGASSYWVKDHPSKGLYTIGHNLDHTDYFVIVQATPWTSDNSAWITGMEAGRYSDHFDVQIIDTNRGLTNATFRVIVIGTPFIQKKNQYNHINKI